MSGRAEVERPWDRWAELRNPYILFPVASELGVIFWAFAHGQRQAHVIVGPFEVHAERLPNGAHITVGFRDSDGDGKEAISG